MPWSSSPFDTPKRVDHFFPDDVLERLLLPRREPLAPAGLDHVAQQVQDDPAVVHDDLRFR